MVVHRAEDGWAHSGGGDLVEHGAERFVVVAHALHEDDVNFARAAAGGRGGQAAEDEGAALGTVGVAAWTGEAVHDGDAPAACGGADLRDERG